MSRVDDVFSAEFNCPKCKHVGANVERLAMSGTGISRFLELQLHRYLFASCENCGYTEIYNLRTLEGHDNLGTLLEVLFMD